MNIMEQMVKWSQEPYKSSMNLTGWLLFIGMMIIVTLMWQQVIKFIID